MGAAIVFYVFLAVLSRDGGVVEVFDSLKTCEAALAAVKADQMTLAAADKCVPVRVSQLAPRT